MNWIITIHELENYMTYFDIKLSMFQKIYELKNYRIFVDLLEYDLNH